MQYKIFWLREHDEKNEIKLNEFLKSHKIINVKTELVNKESDFLWSFCIEYIGENLREKEFKKIDYKSVLTESQYNIFDKLRKIRRHIANENSMQAYTVFLYAELSEISKLDFVSYENIKNIKEINKKRLDKFGKKMIDMYKKDVKVEASK